MVPITLHTPLSFTGCFPDRCRPSQPCCAQNRGFLLFLRPPAPPVAHLNASCTPEIQPIFARCSPDKPQAPETVSPGAPASKHIVLPWKPQEQGCSVLLRPLLLLHTARIPAGSAVSLPNNAPPCAAVVQLSLPATAVSHDGIHLHTDHARLLWSAFLLRRGKVYSPKGGIKSLWSDSKRPRRPFA